MKLSPNRIKKIESDRKFAWGRVRMYIENTRQKFNYIIDSGFPVGETRKIKITNEDMKNEYIIQFLRETSWER